MHSPMRTSRGEPDLLDGTGVFLGGRSTIPCEAPLAYCIDCHLEGANAVQRCGRTLLDFVPADAFLYFAGDKVGMCQRGGMVALPARSRVARFRAIPADTLCLRRTG